MNNLVYILLVYFLLFCGCKEEETQTTIVSTSSDENITKQESLKVIIKKVSPVEDIYYLPKDSTVFMEYSYGYFRFFFDKDTTTFFKANVSEENGHHFRAFYKEKDIGGLYTDYNYRGEHRLDKPNMIYVFFENNHQIVPHRLADKEFTFLLKEDED